MRGKGLQGNELSVDWAKMMAFKHTFTDTMPQRITKSLEKLGVVQFHGNARFTTPGTVQIGDQELHARNFHIATGARPMTLGIPGEEFLTTSTQFLELESIPRRIAFVGGGFIAFEFAHIARRAGTSEVTILQRGSRPLVQFDADMVDIQIQRSRDLGIDIRCQTRVESILKDGDELRVNCVTPQGSQSIVCDLVVHGAGRVANIDALDLRTAGVEVGKHGIRVSEFMRSVSNPTVFAAGDCADTGAPNLTPISANEARIAAKNMLAGSDARRVKYPPIPSVVFTLPPLARVGLLEEQARQQGLDFDVNLQQTGNWYSSMRVGEHYSASKVLVQKKTGQILGAHLIGPGAEEQINLFTMAMGSRLSANQLKGIIFAYPSYASDLGSMV
jgi:glutathione reductase (NADPH)